MTDPRIERKIIIGMIVSRDFLQQIQPYFKSRLLKAGAAKRLSRWCMEYFEQQKTSPGKDIETIFLTKLKQDRIPEDIAEEIEEDILPSLSEEYASGDINVEYLLEQARTYFRERHLQLYNEEVRVLLDQGELLEAEKLVNDYKPLSSGAHDHIDLSDKEVLSRIELAFTTESQSLVKFPRALGEMWQDQLTRGAFVALMASEKRGKSYWLLEIATRASKQGRSVAFFQAGDMTESQQLKRICVYHTKQPVRPLPMAKKFVPVRDCIFNQDDSCNKDEREHDEGIFMGKNEPKAEDIRKKVTRQDLLQKLKEYPDHVPCHNCKEYNSRNWGTPWVKRINPTLITYKSGQEAVRKFFIEQGRKFKLSTHANNTLTIQEIQSLLDLWERQEGFVPDVVLVDYADLLVAKGTEFRHSQNEIWKGLRGLSQEKHCLVVTATQADAKSYEQERLKLSNFSEDKRKYAHVTAMYGLNQDPRGREKELGIMRVNELVVREAEFYTTREVFVLQNLNIGQPYLTSYW